MSPIIAIKDSECRVTKLVDANGREREIATGKCPCCKGGLFVIVKNLLGMHMSHAETLYLVEALRQGPAWQLLKPSPIGSSGRKFATQLVTGGKWLLAYGPDGVADFVCSGELGLPPGLGAHAVAFTVAQREQFADLMFATLMEHATDVARA